MYFAEKSEEEMADKVPEDEPVKQPENTGSDVSDTDASHQQSLEAA